MPVLLDPEFVILRTGNRPFILLSFDIRDQKGVRPQRIKRVIGDAGGISPEEIALLTCGSFFGTIASNRPDLPDPWHFQFKKGRYTVKATAEIKMRTFLSRQNDEYRNRVMARFRIKPQHLAPMTPDLVLVSPEQTFTVEN